MNIIQSTPEWLRDLQFWFRRLQTKLPNRQFSNFGEQRIIDKYIERLKIRESSQTVVDIGAGDGIRSSNTYHLFSSGWTGVGIEVDKAKFERLNRTYRPFRGVSACNSMISPENVSEILRSYSIEPDFGLLSIDIDGNDYWVLDAILSKYRPRLLVAEYNEKIPPPVKFKVKFDPAFELRHHFFGYSISKLDDLLQRYDYALLEIEYNNAFLAPKETPGVDAKAIIDAYDKGYRNRPDRRTKFPMNENMEILQTLSPKDCVVFLDNFYFEHSGKYTIDVDQVY